jgi:flagellar protein FlbT
VIGRRGRGLRPLPVRQLRLAATGGPLRTPRRDFMALKVELKPGERMILGECVITNHDQRTRLLIEGHAPILREKDILTKEQADTPAKRIYLALQLMYISQDPRRHHDVYFSLVRDILAAAPSMWPMIQSINNHILTGETYKALKQARKLIAYEQDLLDNAKRRTGLRGGGKADRQSA